MENFNVTSEEDADLVVHVVRVLVEEVWVGGVAAGQCWRRLDSKLGEKKVKDNLAGWVGVWAAHAQVTHRSRARGSTPGASRSWHACHSGRVGGLWAFAATKRPCWPRGSPG